MSELIDRQAFIDRERKLYCEDCDRRKGKKNGKLTVCYEIGEAPCRSCWLDDALTDLDDAPTIDAVPVVHGHWIIDGAYTYDLKGFNGPAYEPVYRCSCCNRQMESYLRLDEPKMPEDADFPEYCPHCGARMDGGREQE